MTKYLLSWYFFYLIDTQQIVLQLTTHGTIYLELVMASFKAPSPEKEFLNSNAFCVY